MSTPTQAGVTDCTHTVKPSSNCQHCMQLDRRTASTCCCCSCWCRCTSLQLQQRAAAALPADMAAIPAAVQSADQGETAVCRLLSHVRHSVVRLSHTHWPAWLLQKKARGARWIQILNNPGQHLPPCPRHRTHASAGKPPPHRHKWTDACSTHSPGTLQGVGGRTTHKKPSFPLLRCAASCRAHTTHTPLAHTHPPPVARCCACWRCC